MPEDPARPVPPTDDRCPPGRARRGLAALAVAGLAALGACAQDTSEGGTAPEDAEPGPAELPEGGGDDPTLSGEDSGGVGDGETGGTGSGSPDDGDMEGEVGDPGGDVEGDG